MELQKFKKGLGLDYAKLTLYVILIISKQVKFR